VFETLLAGFSPLLGQAGSEAVLRRSISQTAASFPCYAAARNANAGLMMHIRACWHTDKATVALEASVALLVTYFQTVGSLVGGTIMWHLLKTTWPQIVVPPPKESSDA
jgi:hypothetical protein